jgi:hypothetical protein
MAFAKTVAPDPLAKLSAERAALAQELATVNRTIAAPADNDVDALERALQRSAALQLRLGAVDALIARERDALAAAERERQARERAALVAQADGALAALVPAILEARSAALAAQALYQQAGEALIAPGQTLADGLEQALAATWPGRFMRGRTINGENTFTDRG